VVGLEPPFVHGGAPAPQVTVQMPVHQGRSLDSWLQDLVCTPCGPQFEPAAEAIRAMGAASIPYLLYRIERESHEDLAVTAFRILGPQGRSAVSGLTEIYRRDPTSASAARALVYLSADAPVIQALSSPTQKVRENAVGALGSGGAQVDAAAIPPLIENLESGSTHTRSLVVWALSSIHKRDDLVIPVLLRLVDDQDAWIRLCAVQVLARFNLVQTSDRLIQVLEDADPGLRSAAAHSLGESVDRRTSPALVRKIVAALIVKLDDPFDDVRAHAVWALGAIGPRARDAIAPLAKLAEEDVNLQLRERATASLRGINDRTHD
jgi:HEAT repeat protein